MLVTACGGSGYGDNKQGTTTVEPFPSTGGLEQKEHK